MKTIKNWQAFNEMKEEVYRRAAKKLKAMGHEEKAKRLEQHPRFLDRITSVKPYEDLPEFNFLEDIKGKFAGFDWGMTYDMWVDNEKEGISVAPYFVMTRENLGPDMFSPFWISYYKSRERGNPNYNLTIDGPFNVEETSFHGVNFKGSVLEETSGAIFLDNRKDAMRLIKLMRDDISNKIQTLSWFSKAEDTDEFMKMLNRLADKINAKDLFR